MQLLNELMDRGGNYVAAALPFIVSLLARGLAGRALLVAHSLPQILEVMHLGNDVASFTSCGVSCPSWHCWIWGLCSLQEETDLLPLWGTQDLSPCAGVWVAAGTLGLGRSPGPMMQQSGDYWFFH